MKKVIIIGAGPAGLTAADKLLDYKQDYGQKNRIKRWQNIKRI